MTKSSPAPSSKKLGYVIIVKYFVTMYSITPPFSIYLSLKSLDNVMMINLNTLLNVMVLQKKPITNEFMFIMKYARGDLHNYLQEDFTKITWKKKLYIL
jgi:hypothetical protein